MALMASVSVLLPTVYMYDMWSTTIYLKSTNALLTCKLFSILKPFHLGNGIATGRAAKLHSSADCNSMKLLFHPLRLSPLWGHH